MNFEFIKECKPESPELKERYEAVSGALEKAQWQYWRKPQECGIILRGVAEQICRIYNSYYEVGYPVEASLEDFLCYTDDDTHNAMVSRFLSVVRKEQRDRLNKLRVLGDDCIWGEEGEDRGMTFEDRMSQNVKRMMETMMEVTKDMCEKINKRNDISDESFLEEALPESRQQVAKEQEAELAKSKALQKRGHKKSFFNHFRLRKQDEKDSIDDI